MTIEQLTKCSAAELETMTEEQIIEWFSPMFNVIRPTNIPKEVAPKNNTGGKTNALKQAAMLLEQLKKLQEGKQI